MSAMNDFLRQRLVPRDLAGQPRDPRGRFAGSEEQEPVTGQGFDQGARGQSAPPKRRSMNDFLAAAINRNGE